MSTTNGGNRSPMIQERAGREWERGGRGRRGGFSLPRSWVRGRGEWGWFGRAWGEGQLGRALGARLGHTEGQGTGATSPLIDLVTF
jgi:hypothetical protein